MCEHVVLEQLFAVEPSTVIVIVATPLLASDASAVRIMEVPVATCAVGGFLVSVTEGTVLSAESVVVRSVEVAPAMSSSAQ